MVSIEARDAGAECHITVEDDGVAWTRRCCRGLAEAVRTADDAGQHVGLSNVDERLRSVFGDQFGLVVETAPGAGTKVSMRVPKFHPGVRARARDAMSDAGFLRVLAVDDEPPALDELAYLLRADPRVARVHTAGDATEALRVLRDTDVDAVFLDIRMPGLDGMELARVLRRFARPPAIVFVTAYDDGAVDAFDLGVTDYVRKPVQRRAARRVAAPGGRRPRGAAHPAGRRPRARTSRRSRSSWPAPPGCCRARRCAGWRRRATTPGCTPPTARTWSGSRWPRSPSAGPTPASSASTARTWCSCGLIAELRLTNSGYVVVVDGSELPVSRRHTRELKDKLVRAAKQDWNR